MLLLRYYLTSIKSEHTREITGVLFAFIRMKSLLSPNKVRMKSLLYNKMYPSWYEVEPFLV
ncbi:hypothetical protein CLV99_2805 [Sphingobacterium yanglingense]|uniref:Uncharacterized protein n=1 Tax=Sphingobacterium yanglingense TaxID=1437280 RepID=A0A4R6WCU5_9SPHI|nr:hypothetical protein CLV99_2805 [Sphingobacterium yanglingense]